jgi:hypothetical protein
MQVVLDLRPLESLPNPLLPLRTKQQASDFVLILLSHELVQVAGRDLS